MATAPLPRIATRDAVGCSARPEGSQQDELEGLLPELDAMMAELVVAHEIPAMQAYPSLLMQGTRFLPEDPRLLEQCSRIPAPLVH
jgi:hypothetical protein